MKAPAFSFAKLNGMDAYLSPEMKSTGEAIGYDEKLPRAMYKALIASGVKMHNYGTVLVTLADEDKEEARRQVKTNSMRWLRQLEAASLYSAVFKGTWNSYTYTQKA